MIILRQQVKGAEFPPAIRIKCLVSERSQELRRRSCYISQDEVSILIIICLLLLPPLL